MVTPLNEPILVPVKFRGGASMPAFFEKLVAIAREENEHINESLEARARSSVYVCEGVSALVFIILCIYELIYCYVSAALTLGLPISPLLF